MQSDTELFTEEKNIQNQKKAALSGKKNHRKIQDKKTRKRMKKNKKKGNKYVGTRKKKKG